MPVRGTITIYDVTDQLSDLFTLAVPTANLFLYDAKDGYSPANIKITLKTYLNGTLVAGDLCTYKWYINGTEINQSTPPTGLTFSTDKSELTIASTYNGTFPLNILVEVTHTLTSKKAAATVAISKFDVSTVPELVLSHPTVVLASDVSNPTVTVTLYLYYKGQNVISLLTNKQWQYYDGSQWQNIAGATNDSFSVTTDYVNKQIKFKCKFNNQDFEQTVYVQRANIPSVILVLSNESVTIPCDQNGTPLSGLYTGSGTTIYVYEGSQLLVPTSGTPSLGQYKVTVSTLSGITAGTITVPANPTTNRYVTVGDHSSITQNALYIDYKIEGKTNAGTDFTIYKRQNIQKVLGGQNLVVKYIAPSVYAVQKLYGANTYTPASVTCNLYQVVGSTTSNLNCYWKVQKSTDGTNFVDALSKTDAAVNTYTYTLPNESLKLIKFLAYSDSLLTQLIDSETIVIIEQATPPTTYWLTADTYLIVFTDSDGNSKNVTVTFTAKQQRGLEALSNLSSGTIKFYLDGTYQSGKDVTVTNGSLTLNSFAISRSNKSLRCDLIVSSVVVDSVEIPIVVHGSSTITVILSNETLSIPADELGNVPSDAVAGTGTIIYCYYGATKLTPTTNTSLNNSQFRIKSTSVSPANLCTVPLLTITADNGLAVGDITFSNAVMKTADQATITYTIEYKLLNGTVGEVQKVQTFTKAKSGYSLVVVIELQGGTILTNEVTQTTLRLVVYKNGVVDNATDTNGGQSNKYTYQWYKGNDYLSLSLWTGQTGPDVTVTTSDITSALLILACDVNPK